MRLFKEKYLLNTIVILVAFAFGFAISRFMDSSKTIIENSKDSCSHIKELFDTHKLLKRCKQDERVLAFLRKGGEYFPDYENPRTLNDKIGYILRNYFQKSPVTKCIGNKYHAKKYVADTVGMDHVVKLFGVWDNPEDIEWNKLPNRFVLKAVRGHFGRQVILIKDKSKLDIPETIKKLKEFCQTPGMKWTTKKRIIAEEYLEQPNGYPVIDYKFFCSHGNVIVAYCLADSGTKTHDADERTLSFYTIPEWKKLPILIDDNQQNSIHMPKHLAKMIDLTEKLSKPFPLIRIDLYEIGNRILVGELTEDADGAKYIFSPVIWDFKLGEMIDVPSLDEIEKMIEKDKKKYGNLEI